MLNLVAKLHVLLLLIASPVTLFQRINRLNWYHQMLVAWIDSMPIFGASQVLEIGCATGELSQYLSSKGFQITAVDKSIAMLRRAVKNNSVKKNQNGVQYCVASVFNLPVKPNSADVVVAASLLNIVPDPVKALIEMRRVMKVGGVVSVLVPSAAFSLADFAILLPTLKISGFSRAALITWYENAPKMSQATLCQYLADAGFVEMKTQQFLNGMVISISASKPITITKSL